MSGDRASSSRAGALSPLARRQYAALISLQTRIFLNSFRTRRGRVDLGARILGALIFLLISVGPAIGLGAAAWAGVAQQRTLALDVILWVLFLVWQFFSAFAPALAGQNPDLRHLLRFPVSLGSWLVLYLAYGTLTPSTFIGLLWSLSIGIGITMARPALFLPALVTLALFALFNILLSRAILAWVERWMTQRRTREIITAGFLFLLLGAQWLNPAFHRYGNGPPFGPGIHRPVVLPHRVSTALELLPAGLATASISQPMKSSGSGALALAGLALYTVAVTALLGLRLQSESRGEAFSEAPRVRAVVSPALAERRPAFNFSGPIGAVFEKDLRYLLRSGPMLYSLAAPVLMVILFSTTIRIANASMFRSAFALPVGIIWAFVGLTRLVNNNLGGECEGISFYFLSPTPLRSVILGKNALHLVLFLTEAFLISAVVIARFGFPEPATAAASLAWILFAIPATLAAGNLLSIRMPYRMSMTRMRRESGAMGNNILSLIAQTVILGLGVLAYVPFEVFGYDWLATPVLLLLAGASVVAYLRILSRVDNMIESRRDALLFEIAKTPAQ